MKKSIFLSVILLLTLQANSLADAPFRAHRYDVINTMPVHSDDIVFVGNSITNMHEWWEAFGCDTHILNRGVSGCVSEETLANIGKVIEGHPAKVFLMVGTNDIGTPGLDDPDMILGNVEKIVDRFIAESPETELYIQSVLPVAATDKRPAEKITALNDLYKELCSRKGITYVDLWSRMVEPGTTHINPAYTADGLHLYPSGYREWCSAIAPLVGHGCVYPDSEYSDYSLNGSLAMRAAAFSQLQLEEDDIVLIGDEMIHGGEWHELLGSRNVKNRGTGWGFGGPVIERIQDEIPAIFNSGKTPAQIYLHAGAAEASWNIPADTIAFRYRKLVNSLKEAAPGSDIRLMAIQPIYINHHKVTTPAEVNSRIKEIAEETGCGFVDIFSPLADSTGNGDIRYVCGNYVYGKGYLKISRILAREMGLKPVEVIYATRETAFTGRGNSGEKLISLTVSPAGKMRLRKVRVSLDADPSDVTDISVRCNGIILGNAAIKPGKTIYTIPCRYKVDDLCDIDICADIADDAGEGGKVSADIKKVKFGMRWTEVNAPEPGFREILLRRTKVLGPGDYGSAGYRIPAIICLPDSTLLITSDKRKYNDLDLPTDIDIIAQRSTDGGRTWSDPVNVAEGKGFNKGFGDAALELTFSGDVLCAYSGGYGVWPSTLENPQRNYISRSRDGGKTWDEPYDCTSRLWGPKADKAACKDFHSAFFASGRGLRLKKGQYAGRIMFVAAVHSSKLNRFDNYVVYSDDDGSTWEVSDCAFIGGDEAKAVELPDGKVLLSVRRYGERGWNISEDGGRTWGKQGTWPEICVNACDGDIISLGDTVLLHSVPNSMTRRNVSVFVSHDNGKTWPYARSLCKYESVYSSMTVLPDGTIGAYIEENPKVGFDMYYLNFSYDWLISLEKQAGAK